MDSRYLITQRSGLSRSLRDGDFEEEDVWGVLKERNYDFGESIESPRSLPRSVPTAARMVPRGSSGSISSNHASHEPRIVQQSAPVNIPDWSNICGKNANRSSKNATSMLDGDDTDEEYGDHEDEIVKDGVDSDDEDERDDFDYNGKMPPHEFIARRLARSQISSFSVFEGVGRTLKGRDLSKVRNAVLTKTGFLESL